MAEGERPAGGYVCLIQRRAYQFLDVLFEGRNPYIESIDRNMTYRDQVLRSESWRMLRRSPQVYAAEPDSLTSVRGLMASYFKRAWSK